MPFFAAKIGTGKHLGFVLLAWAVFFLLAAWVLPPLDSHLRPTPMVYRSVLTLTILLALPTVIVVPAYVYRAWLRRVAHPLRRLQRVGIRCSLPVTYTAKQPTEFSSRPPAID